MAEFVLCEGVRAREEEPPPSPPPPPPPPPLYSAACGGLAAGCGDANQRFHAMAVQVERRHEGMTWEGEEEEEEEEEEGDGSAKIRMKKETWKKTQRRSRQQREEFLVGDGTNSNQPHSWLDDLRLPPMRLHSHSQCCCCSLPAARCPRRSPFHPAYPPLPHHCYSPLFHHRCTPPHPQQMLLV